MAITVAELMARLVLDSTPFNKGLEDAGRKTQEAESKLTRFGERASKIGSSLTSIALPMAAIGGASMKMAGDFDDSMTRIQGLVGVNQKQVEQWKGQIMDMAPAMGKTSKELAEGLYFITSSGIDTSKAMEVLEQSAKASAAGLGSTSTVADMVTSAMNAYGVENLSAAQATDILTAAVREGKTEPEELAMSLGRVLPIAAQLGVGFADVAAATSTMSLSGLDAAEATTALRGVLGTILGPTEQAKEALAGMGTNADELRAMLQEKGLLQTLQFMADKFQGNSEAADAVIGNVRALTGFLNLTGQEGQKVAGIFNDVANATGDTDEAFQAMSQSSGFELRQAMAELNNAMIDLGNAIGPTVLPVLKAMIGAMADAASLFGMLPGPIKSVVVGFGLLVIGGAALTRALGSVVGAWTTLTAASTRGAAAQAAAATGMATTTTAATATAGATRGLGAALGGLSAALGPVAIGIAGIVGQYMIWKPAATDAEKASDSLKEALSRQGEAATSAVQAIIGSMVTTDKAREAFEKTGITASGFAATLARLGPVTDEFKVAADPMVQRLKEIAAGGGEAGKQAERLLVDIGNWRFEFQDASATAKDFNAAQQATAGAVASATAAVQGNTSAVDANTQAAKINVAAQRSFADANQSLMSAEQKWASALDGIREAQTKSSGATKKATDNTKELFDAKSSLEQATHGVTKAIWNQEEAQAALDKLMAPATAEELAAAALDVAKAKLAEKEATNDLAKAQQELTDLQKEAVTVAEQIKAAEQGLAAARQKVVDAQAGVVAVQKRINDLTTQGIGGLSKFAESFQANVEKMLDPLKRFEANVDITFKSVMETLTGNIKDFEVWSANLKALSARGFTALAQQFQQLGPQAATALQQAVKASDSELGKMNELFEKQAGYVSGEYAFDMAKGLGDVGYDTVELAKLQGDLGEAQDDVTKATDDVTAAQQTLSDLQGRAQQINADLKDAALAVEGAEIKVKEAVLAVNTAQGAQNTLLERGKTITEEIEAAQRKVEEATWAVKAAQDQQHSAQLAYNEAMSGGKQPTDDLGTSMSDLKGKQDAAFGAAQSLAQAYVDQKTKAAELKGEVIDDTEKHRLYIEKLQQVAGELAPGSPLRDRLNAYIGDLQRVPKEVKTNITADIKSLPISVAPAIGGKPGMISIPIMPAQHGGPAGPGMPRWVGEKGPELFWPEDSGTIVPNYALGGGGVTNYVEVNVEGSVVSERRLIDVVHEGLKRKNRESGTLGLN